MAGGTTRPLLPVAEAQARLLGLAEMLPVETVRLRAAAGRWLAQDLIAARMQPGADLSMMDGYAIRYADLPGAWRVVGESAAGRPLARAIVEREAVRIFTGAALPAGADTVLVQEEAARDGDVLLLAGEGPARVGANVRPAGMDFRQSEVLLEAGMRLSPAAIGLAAIAGYDALPVRRRVRVTLLASGDELVPPGTPLSDALTLPEANGAMLAAMMGDLPVDTTDSGIMPDDLDAVTAAFRAADADVIVTTGGASVGDHDLIRPALQSAGAAIDFWRVALRPGRPMLAGRLGQAIVLGLPGNPVSAFVTATLFLRPLIAALSGARDPLPRAREAILGAALSANDNRQDYLRATLIDGRVVPAASQDSAQLSTLAGADCLIVRQPHAPSAQPGDPCEILSIA